MKKADVIEYFGGIPQTAKALGLSRQSVYLWGDDVPELRAYQIESLTQGKLKAVKK